jgi:predicted DNA-binding transcriptional regulator YafY
MTTVGVKKPIPERRPDSAQLIRQWTLLKLLSDSPKAWTVKELSEQTKVSKPTIERDLATLEQQFAVVEENVGKQKKTYRIDGKIRALESITFGVTELLAIFAAHASLTGLAGTPIHEDLQQVMTKIRGFLSPRHNGGLDAMARVFMPHKRDSVNYEPQQEIIDDLVNAVAQRKRCQITYHSPSKGTTRTHQARPLKLTWHNSTLYLFACLGDREEVSTLAVQRIREVSVSQEKFSAPKADVEAIAKKAFGIFVSDDEQDVEILFDKDIAWKLAERTFHPDETKETLPDGSVRYRVRSSAQWEVIPWVQTFGPFAELLAPASWRDSLRANLSAMREKYERT